MFEWNTNLMQAPENEFVIGLTNFGEIECKRHNAFWLGKDHTALPFLQYPHAWKPKEDK